MSVETELKPPPEVSSQKIVGYPNHQEIKFILRETITNILTPEDQLNQASSVADLIAQIYSLHPNLHHPVDTDNLQSLTLNTVTPQQLIELALELQDTELKPLSSSPPPLRQEINLLAHNNPDQIVQELEEQIQKTRNISSRLNRALNIPDPAETKIQSLTQQLQALQQEMRAQIARANMSPSETHPAQPNPPGRSTSTRTKPILFAMAAIKFICQAAIDGESVRPDTLIAQSLDKFSNPLPTTIESAFRLAYPYQTSSIQELIDVITACTLFEANGHPDTPTTSMSPEVLLPPELVNKYQHTLQRRDPQLRGLESLPTIILPRPVSSTARADGLGYPDPKQYPGYQGPREVLTKQLFEK